MDLFQRALLVLCAKAVEVMPFRRVRRAVPGPLGCFPVKQQLNELRVLVLLVLVRKRDMYRGSLERF